jgi:SAM-dependent methyltransferase
LFAAITECINFARSVGLLRAHSTVIDVGCGASPYREAFSVVGANYIGCDIGPGPDVDILISDNGQISLGDEAADCILSFQVLEHVWDLDLYLNECRRLLRQDGMLMLSTHGVWLYHPHPNDYRRWTRDGLLKELSSRGFDIIKTWSVVGPLAWTTQFRTLAYNHVLSQHGAVGKLCSALLCYLMYWRMVVEDQLTPSVISRDNAAVYLIVARRSV